MTNETVSKDVFHAMFTEHRELMAELADLRRWWGEVQQFGIPKYGEMGSRLKELRGHLQTHFGEEECGGYLAAALAVAPRLSGEAERLRLQHRLFLDTLDGFIESLQSLEPPFRCWDETRQQLDDFLLGLRRHESAENAIVQAAFGDDAVAAD